MSGSGAGLLLPHTLDTHCRCCAAVGDVGDVVFFVLGDHTLSHCTGQDNALHRGILWQCSVLTRPSTISSHAPAAGC